MNLDVGGDAGTGGLPCKHGVERRFVYRRDTGGGQFKGRYRVGGEVALFDAEGGSNISGADFAHTIVEEIDNPAGSSSMSSTEPTSGGHAPDQAADLRRRVHAAVPPGRTSSAISSCSLARSARAPHRARPTCATRAGSSIVTRVLTRA